MSTFEVVLLEEKQFVGLPVSNSFHYIDDARMRAANEEFMRRRHEIKHAINMEQYVCPHFSNDILFTYVYSMEVSEISDIPEGMLGFTVPKQTYVKITSTDENPYEISHRYFREHGLANNTRSLALEVFQFSKRQHFNDAEIYIPILLSEESKYND